MVDDVGLRRESLTRILAVVRGLGAGIGLDETLARISQAVVDVLEFGAVVINVRTPDGDLLIKTVLGPPEVHELVGQRMEHSTWLELLADCEPWGDLRFHADIAAVEVDGVARHVDPSQRWLQLARSAGVPEEDLWLPTYSLFAPMWAGPDDLLGVISVDLPRSGRAPDAEQRAMLELFAGQAGAAIAEAERIDTAVDDQILYRTVFLETPIPTAMLDRDLRLLEVNEAFASLTGYHASLLVGNELSAILDKESSGWPVCEDASGSPADQKFVHPDGTVRWAHIQLRRVEGSTGSRFVATAQDHTETRQALRDLKDRAEHDDLTGLSVRSVARDDLATRLANHTPGLGLIAFLFCDLDDFKKVNDAYGHPVGDQLLIEIARRLRTSVRADDLVSRFGGDEFAIIAERSNLDELRRLAQVCMDAAAVPFCYHRPDPGSKTTAPLTFSVTLSMGAASVSGAQTLTVDELIRSADDALYASKRDPDISLHIKSL